MLTCERQAEGGLRAQQFLFIFSSVSREVYWWEKCSFNLHYFVDLPTSEKGAHTGKLHMWSCYSGCSLWFLVSRALFSDRVQGCETPASQTHNATILTELILSPAAPPEHGSAAGADGADGDFIKPETVNKTGLRSRTDKRKEGAHRAETHLK